MISLVTMMSWHWIASSEGVMDESSPLLEMVTSLELSQEEVGEK
jgi:hypothetical protein